MSCWALSVRSARMPADAQSSETVLSCSQVGAVIVGFDRHVNYHKIQMATLCIRENPGCLFIATNLDAVTHLTDAQEWAGNGSMVGAIKGEYRASSGSHHHLCIHSEPCTERGQSSSSSSMLKHRNSFIQAQPSRSLLLSESPLSSCWQTSPTSSTSSAAKSAWSVTALIPTSSSARMVASPRLSCSQVLGDHPAFLIIYTRGFLGLRLTTNPGPPSAFICPAAIIPWGLPQFGTADLLDVPRSPLPTRCDGRGDASE